MTKLLHRVEASVRSFYIFNSNYGQSEGEEDEKILYYHPKDIELNTKIKDVGLSEAIISFIRTFSDNNGCERVHTMKTNQVFFEAEDDFWMVLTLNVPRELRSKGNVEYEDYHNGELCDAYYRRILEYRYNLFRLRNGSFDWILKRITNNSNTRSSKATELKRKLENFYDEFLGNLVLSNCNVIQYIRSVQYLSLDKALFLKVHNFINTIKGTFPLIIDALFLYNDTLVCGGKFQPIELYTIYNHVLDTLSGDSSPSNSNNICNNLDQSTLQDIYVTWDNTLIPVKLLIHHINSASLCLFFNNVNSDVELIKNTCKELISSHIIAQLNILANEIGDRITALAKISSLQQQSNTSDMETISPKYLFINEQTLQHFTNIINIRSIPNSSNNFNLNLIPTNVMHILIDLANASFGPLSSLSSRQADSRKNIYMPPFEETVVKSTSDFWIIKQQCNWRQFYVIIFSKKATLLDVTAEAERIFQQYIKDDVFFDK